MSLSDIFPPGCARAKSSKLPRNCNNPTSRLPAKCQSIATELPSYSDSSPLHSIIWLISSRIQTSSVPITTNGPSTCCYAIPSLTTGDYFIIFHKLVEDKRCANHVFGRLANRLINWMRWGWLFGWLIGQANCLLFWIFS